MIKIFKQLLPLFVVQFFTWLGLFSLWIYATPVVTRYIFKTTDAESNDFANGTTWVGICFAFYSLLAAILGFFVPTVLRYISKEKLHAIALMIGGVGLSLFYFVSNKYMLLFCFTFIGIAWSSISTIPYSIISAIAPEEKMPTYFAVFNFSVVIPQITAAFLLGYLNKSFFAGETLFVILSGGISMMVAAVVMYLFGVQKKDSKSQIQK